MALVHNFIRPGAGSMFRTLLQYSSLNCRKAGICCPVTLFVRQVHSEMVYQSTIFSLSSGHGKCGVAVIRVSGPEARSAIKLLTQRDRPPPARKAALHRIHHPTNKLILDRALVLWFPGPESFSGEDTCELHTHGGPAVISAVLEALGSIPGLRHAEPGEYTKRAFQNGKMDLVEVEGLADLIHAETEYQRQQALLQMEGTLSSVYSSWRSRLLKCVANTEAYIDFSEEDNIEDNVLAHVEEETDKLKEEIEGHLADNRRGERLRSGVQVAIIGQPNVGKSSLLNAICRRPAAIVSPIAGTTRDVIETALNIGGYPVVLSDTAGLRQATDDIEEEGIHRAMARAHVADIKILVMDIRQLLHGKNCLHLTTSAHEQEHHYIQSVVMNHLAELGFSSELQARGVSSLEKSEDRELDKLTLVASDSNIQTTTAQHNTSIIETHSLIVVFNKIDLIDFPKQNRSSNMSSSGEQKLQYCFISCKDEDGMDQFLELLQTKVQLMCGKPSAGNPSLTQARHRTHLEVCVDALTQYKFMSSTDAVIGAELLRQALRHLGKITGQVTSEEILDVIFKDFCIGK